MADSLREYSADQQEISVKQQGDRFLSTELYISSFVIAMFASSIPLSGEGKSYDENLRVHLVLAALPQLLFLLIICVFAWGGPVLRFGLRVASACVLTLPMWIWIAWKWLRGTQN